MYNETIAYATSFQSLTLSTVKDARPVPIYELGIVTTAMWQEFLYYIRYIGLVCCFFGSAFSALSMIVYIAQQRKSQRKDAYIALLIAICSCDFIFSFSKFAVYAYGLKAVGTTKSKAESYLDIILDLYVTVTFRRAAVCLNVLATLERYLTIAFPFGKAATAFKRDTAAIIILVVFVVCLAHSYFFFEYTVLHIGGDEWTMYPSEAKLARPDLFESVKNIVRILLFYVPVFGSLVLNLALMIVLRRHLRSKQDMRMARGGSGTTQEGSKETDAKAESKTNSTEEQAAKLILLLTFTFCLCALPGTLNATIATYLPEYGVTRRQFFLYGLLLSLFNLIMFLTHVPMFLVSAAFSSRFRQNFLGLFGIASCLAGKVRKGVKGDNDYRAHSASSVQRKFT